MAEGGWLGERMGKGIEVEIESLGDEGGGGHLADADRVQRGVEIGERGIDVEATGSGGGFGGCAIAVVPVDAVDTVTRAVLAAFDLAAFVAPSVFSVGAVDGAGPVVSQGVIA